MPWREICGPIYIFDLGFGIGDDKAHFDPCRGHTCTGVMLRKVEEKTISC